ncbi:hypothetical protein ADL29_12020 [Streptomyces chattanoogensis]|uniref:Ku domain-containing protein n=1 Tax=Streptomyces chattanoogensis TaxID=66876 RepID=A0A0N1JYR9_9ACTN|nr:hypothetical protein ADL29_12020 [Streptomyces chattanoogensis]
MTFGLVTLPVMMYTATDSHTIHFHQLQRGTSDRIRHQRVNERTGEEVSADDIVKAFDAGDEYVLVVLATARYCFHLLTHRSTALRRRYWDLSKAGGRPPARTFRRRLARWSSGWAMVALIPRRRRQARLS